VKVKDEQFRLSSKEARGRVYKNDDLTGLEFGQISPLLGLDY
jgi:hypothetical protein